MLPDSIIEKLLLPILILPRKKRHLSLGEHRHRLDLNHQRVRFVVLDALVDPDLVGFDDYESLVTAVEVRLCVKAFEAVLARPVA